MRLNVYLQKAGVGSRREAERLVADGRVSVNGVKAQATAIVNRLGARALTDFAKLHFRTAYEVVSAAGKLGELPLPEPKAKMDW